MKQVLMFVTLGFGLWAQAQVSTSNFGALEPVNVCSTLKQTTVSVNGQSVARYNVSKSELIKCLPQAPAAPWRVVKTSWSADDELRWEKFVQGIGRAVASGQCATMDSCLISEHNPYRDAFDFATTHYADCADFPLYMRSYFAFKNGLPFSFGTGLIPNAATPQQLEEARLRLQTAQEKLWQMEARGATLVEIQNQQAEVLKLQQKQLELTNPDDTRYSRNGNYFGSRMSVPHSGGVVRDFAKITRQIHDGVSSGSYRMLLTPPGRALPDFYSPKIDRQSIRAGTVVYKPTGHVALVYDITPEGEILLVDAHPDNSLTSIKYNQEFMKSLPTHGAGFKNWRPLQVINVEYDRTGAISKGLVTLAADNQIADVSFEQYVGNADPSNFETGKAKYVLAGRELDWYEFVRFRLASGDFKLNPITQFKSDLQGLCVDLQGRAQSVQTAVTAEIPRQPHPVTLVDNIYGAEGDWESYSTPGRDLRIRKRVRDLFENAKTYLRKHASRDPFFSYQGKNLKADLLKTYNDVNSSCRIQYLNSKGTPVPLGLTTALKRLSQMSFDPYLCVERRWGAAATSELVTCMDDTEKIEWHRSLQFLRNQLERDPNEVMGWSLQDLRDLEKRGRIDNQSRPADFQLLNLLESL